MIHFESWKIWTILMISLWGLLYAAPNLSPQEWRDRAGDISGILPHKTISLGLDLQGGAHLLLQADMDYAVTARVEDLEQALRRSFARERIGHAAMRALANPAAGEYGVAYRLRNMDDRDRAYRLTRNLHEGIDVRISPDGTARATLNAQALTEIKTRTLNQSIEIVRRRIDETGTREPVIQRQGHDRILVQLPGVDDPERIKELLVRTASMTLHLVDEEASQPGARIPPGTVVYPQLGNPDATLAVLRRVALHGERLIDAQPSFDEGTPIVQFRFDQTGAREFCTITRENVGRRFAWVLDGEIVTAPVINTAICGGSGIITGRFTIQETVDTSLLMRAGALPAPLIFVEERTVGPSLGADSVEAGKIASIMGLSFVLIFMVLVYGLFGIFASVALLINIMLIFAVLSTLQATLTLPGIAGIVLTIGMAVDANVLIFERIREELRNGRSVISAVDTGYGQAMSSIIDAQVTTLIAALLLFSFGTGPIKGFAVTLWIGIMTSMFSAIWLTRLMVVTWLKQRKPKVLPI